MYTGILDIRFLILIFHRVIHHLNVFYFTWESNVFLWNHLLFTDLTYVHVKWPHFPTCGFTLYLFIRFSYRHKINTFVVLCFYFLSLPKSDSMPQSGEFWTHATSQFLKQSVGKQGPKTHSEAVSILDWNNVYPQKKTPHPTPSQYI